MHQVTELDEIQKMALEILLKVDEFCKEKQIDYFLAYGTLLGAVRHEGFIPWDDDIDLWMKRDQFQRMINEFPQWGENKGLYLNSAETTNGYNRVHAQICMADTLLIANDRNNPFKEGYFIDVFPIDGTPNSKYLRMIRLKHLQLVKNIGTLSAYALNKKPNATIKQKGIGVLAKPFHHINTQKVMKKYGAIASKTTCENSKQLQTMSPRNSKGKNIVMPSSWFNSAKDNTFETISAPIPIGYVQILMDIYGNYMSLPPETERIPHHDFKLYKID